MSSFLNALRLMRVGFVLGREGALALVDPNDLPSGGRVLLRMARLIERRDAGDGAQRLAKALTRLGPSYVKFGQFLATRPDVVGVRVARDLEQLQDRLPPFPRSEAVSTIEQSFGAPLDSLYIELGAPMAAASIAQVHQGMIADDDTARVVAVKVLRPGVRARFRRDLNAMHFAAAQLEQHVPDLRRLKPVDVVDTLARSVTMEMDLRLEAAAL
jgi:ubiquinone biosynthesis protein